MGIVALVLSLALIVLVGTGQAPAEPVFLAWLAGLALNCAWRFAAAWREHGQLEQVERDEFR